MSASPPGQAASRLPPAVAPLCPPRLGPQPERAAVPPTCASSGAGLCRAGAVAGSPLDTGGAHSYSTSSCPEPPAPSTHLRVHSGGDRGGEGNTRPSATPQAPSPPGKGRGGKASHKGAQLPPPAQHSTAPPGHPPPLPAGGRLIPAAAWQGAPAAPARSPAPRPRKGPGPRGAARPRTRLRPGAAPARPAPPAAGARRRGAGGQGGRGRAACGGAISRNVQGNWHRPSSGHPAPAPATSRPGTAAAASPVSPAAPPLLTAARDEYGVEAHRGPADSHPPRHQKLGGGRGGADSPRGSQRRETAHEAALRPPTKRAVGGGWLVPEAAATRRAWPCTQSLPCSGGDHTHTRKRVPPHAACSHAQAVLCPAPRSRQRTRRSTRRCRARLGRLRFRQGSCAQPPQARPGALCHVPVSQGDDSGLASPRSGLR